MSSDQLLPPKIADWFVSDRLALDRIMVGLRAAHPLPDRPVWPVVAELPDLGLSTQQRAGYDAELGPALREAGQYLTFARPATESVEPVLRGSDELTYLARRRAPAGVTAPVEVMFPASWTLDDVRLAAARLLHAPDSVVSTVTGEPDVVRLVGRPGLPVEVTVHRPAQGAQTVRRIAPAAPINRDYLLDAVRAAGITAAQRAVLPSGAHDHDGLAFALAQIDDHPTSIKDIETGIAPDDGAERYGEFAGVFAGVVTGRAMVRYFVSSRADFDSFQYWPRARRVRMDFAGDSTDMSPAQHEGLGQWAEDLAVLVRRFPYMRRFWTVHIVAVDMGPDAAGEPGLVGVDRAGAVQAALRRLLDTALGVDLAASTVRYQRYDRPAAAPTERRIVVWLDHVGDLPGGTADVSPSPGDRESGPTEPSGAVAAGAASVVGAASSIIGPAGWQRLPDSSPDSVGSRLGMVFREPTSRVVGEGGFAEEHAFGRGLVLDRRMLARYAAEVRGDGLRSLSAADCLILVERFATRLHPFTVDGGGGRTGGSGRTVDDIDVGRLWAGSGIVLDPQSWQSVSWWQDVVDAVAAQAGRVGYVLLSRPGQETGHAFLVYHTSDAGVWWVELTAASGPLLVSAELAPVGAAQWGGRGGDFLGVGGFHVCGGAGSGRCGRTAGVVVRAGVVLDCPGAARCAGGSQVRGRCFRDRVHRTARLRQTPRRSPGRGRQRTRDV